MSQVEFIRLRTPEGETEVAVTSLVADALYRLEEPMGCWSDFGMHDVVRVTKERDGIYRIIELVHSAGYRRFDFLLNRDLFETDEVKNVLTKVQELGGQWVREFGGKLIINLPPTAEYDPSQDLVEASGSEGPPPSEAPVEEISESQESSILDSLRLLNKVTRLRADEIAANAEEEQRKGLRAFLASPPNPADLKRKIAEVERDKFIGLSVEQIDEETPDLCCNWCQATLPATLKWAIAPFVMADPPQSTLACISCTETAYVLPNAEARLEALQARGRKRQERSRYISIIGKALIVVVVVWVAWQFMS
jgi:hypothetical protein